jgi:hypothetical protein
MSEADDKAAAKAKADAEAKEKTEREAAEAKAKADDKAAAKAKAARKPYHVVGPGSVFYDEAMRRPGETLLLTEEEAKRMEEAVKPGKPPAPPAAIKDRTGGRYVVAGPGSVWFSGKAREKGFVLELDAAEARSLGAAVVEAPQEQE